MKLPRRVILTAIIALPLLLAATAFLAVLVMQQGGLAPFRVPVGGDNESIATDAATIDRGAYLARIGNCAGCHTVRGGADYAGGRAFPTPYGTIRSSNLTPDPTHGLGTWSPAEFRHTMRHGVSRNGVLSPVFPYANFAHLSDADLDALFAFLRTLPAVDAAPTPSTLEFPATVPGAMFAWRLLYYRPAPLRAPADASPDWIRGQWLVNGLGHCAMCHGERGTFSSLSNGEALAGNRIPGWYAPALDGGTLARYDHGELASYLRGGIDGPSAAYGPMADVIYDSLRHLQPDDATAIATYLQSLAPPPAAATPTRRTAANSSNGDALYRQHCADCHGDDGRGKPGKYPALAGSVSATSADPVNAVKVILFGAVPPTTELNPRPYTMPPFSQKLSAIEVAAVVNAMRQRWGEQTRTVTSDEVRDLGGIELP